MRVKKLHKNGYIILQYDYRCLRIEVEPDNIRARKTYIKGRDVYQWLISQYVHEEKKIKNIANGSLYLRK